MFERYLKFCYFYWKFLDRGLIFMCFVEEELEEGVEEFMVFWNYLFNLFSYFRLENGFEILELRRFSFERKLGEGYVLFCFIG